LFWTNVLGGSSSKKCEAAATGASRTTAPIAKDAKFLILEALQVCLRVLDADDYIIQPDEVVHEANLGRRISGSGPSTPKSDPTPCPQLAKAAVEVTW
jgi:hypothetical protein